MTAETDPFILTLEQTDSTNTYVREHFDELPDLALVRAKFQTAGRGRLGRKWLSPPGVNFCGTFCFKNVADGFHAGMLCGIALMRTVSELLPGVPFYLKWPNDLYFQKSKAAGLLGEGILRQGKIAGIAMGIGLNVNTTQEDLAGTGQSAVSLRMIANQEFNVDFVAKLLAKQLNVCYIMYSDSVPELFSQWRSCNKLIGKTIAVTDACGARFEGVFRDVTPQGEMILEYEEQGVPLQKIFNCCDVSVDKSSL